MMCAGGNWPVGDKGFCPGDSGGPLIVKGANWAQDVQIGSVSYTSGDCIGASECWQHTVMHCGACGAGRVPCQTASGDAMLSAGCPCCSCPQPSLLQLPSAVPVAAGPCVRLPSAPTAAGVYANIPSVWRWINSTVFALTGNYLNEPFKPKTGSGEAPSGCWLSSEARGRVARLVGGGEVRQSRKSWAAGASRPSGIPQAPRTVHPQAIVCPRSLLLVQYPVRVPKSMASTASSTPLNRATLCSREMQPRP